MTCLDNPAWSKYSVAENGDRSQARLGMGEIGHGLEAARKTCRTNKHGWRPFIYALLHCSKTSELPSRSQCETVLDVMEEYTSTQNTRTIRMRQIKNAAEIDMANFPDRRWSINYSKPTKSQEFPTIQLKGQHKTHPRLY